MKRSRRWLTIALGLLLLAVVAAFTLLPPLIGSLANRVDPLSEESPKQASARARSLHARAFVADLHDDVLLWGRDPLERATWGQTDVPRLLEGNVALQVMATVTKVPSGLNFERNRADAFDLVTALALLQRWPVATWTSLYARATHLAAKLDDAVARSEGQLIAVRSRADLDRLARQRAAGLPVLGVLLAAEGMHPLEGDISKLEGLYEAGFRMLAPTHFFDNAVAGSAHGTEKGGLTPFGESAIDRMQQLHIAIDLAHASPATVSDVLDRARGPVLVSHTGVQATCPGPRNLDDAQLRRIAGTGGVVGIGYFDGAVCGTSAAAVVRAMRHVADLVGVEHVALGSDWDGATHVEIDPLRLPLLTQALVDAGFEDDEVLAILGGNALRVLREVLR